MLEGAGVPLLRLLRVSGAEVLVLIPSSKDAHVGVQSHAIEFQNHSQTPPKTDGTSPDGREGVWEKGFDGKNLWV